MQLLNKDTLVRLKRWVQIGTALTLFFLCVNSVSAQIEGTVYKDFNSNGVRDGLNEVGVANIDVEVSLTDGTTWATNTDLNGFYSFNVAQAPLGEDVRVRFPDLQGHFSGLKGSNNRSSVIFTKGGDLSASLGIFSPSEYCEFDGPNILSSCYVNGDPLGGGSAGEDISLVSFPYTASGLANTSPDNQLEYVGQIKETGSVWGMAYQISSKKFLVSALLRRHSGLGPLGTGGIYMADDFNNETVPFLDVQTLGINTGVDRHFQLPADKLIPNEDSLVMHDAGKVGIGGMTFSEDEESLYFINLFDRKLYELEVGVPLNPAYPFKIVGSYDIPDPSGTGDHRPWAVSTHLGEIFVGVVSSAEFSASPIDLKAYVFKLDEETKSFEEQFRLDLEYPRGSSDVTGDCALISSWRPWSDTFPQGCHKVFRAEYNKFVNFSMNPQPILSSITFDIDGSLILGFMDRFGLQVGYRNLRPVDDGELYDGFVGGDLLRAQYDPFTKTFELESGGVSGGVAGVGAGNGQGPGGGEFYGSDTWNFFGNPAHEEIFNGGVLFLSSSRELIVSAMDPVDEIYQSGGIRTISSEDGALVRGFALYSDVPGTLGKSGGVGDFKLVCDPAPVELGNRVWLDTDLDGSQDPGEPGVQGLVVSIFDADNGNLLVGQDTTDIDGVYCFNSSNVSGLNFRKNYKITIQLASDILDPLNVVGLSPQDATDDDLDSDAYLNGNLACIDVSAGFPGEVKHTVDMGLLPCTIPLPLELLNDSSICLGTENFDLPNAPTGAKWLFGAGPVSVEIDTTQGTILDFPIEGIYKFYLVSNASAACKDSVEINVKSLPVLAPSDTICYEQKIYQLEAVQSGGVWTLKEPNSVALTLNASTGLVSEFSGDGDYTFEYDFFGCSDSVTITKRSKINAGDNASYCSFDKNIQLSGLPLGGNWTESSSNSNSALISSEGLIDGFTAAGSYDFIYEVESCTDTVSITVIECQKACVGDYAWFDANNNGIQDNIIDPFDGSVLGPELPAAGIKVYIFEQGIDIPLDSTITDEDGQYKIGDLQAGEYCLKFDNNTYPGNGFEVVGENMGNDDSIDSDFEQNTYKTGNIVLAIGDSVLTWDIGFNRAPEPTITEPCACNADVVYLIDENGNSSNYVFNERVEINATPGGVWRIISEDPNTMATTFGIWLDTTNDGLPNPANAVGMKFEANPNDSGNFFFEFSHTEPLGYTLVVTNGTDTLSINNACTSIKEDYDERLSEICSYGDELVLKTDFPTGTASYYFLSESEFEFSENVDEADLIRNAQPITILKPTDYEAGSTIALYIKWVPKVNLETDEIKICEKDLILNISFSNAMDGCLASLGNQTWIDGNSNGVFEQGEPVLSGVTVTLCDSLENPILKDGLGNDIIPLETDALGQYLFTNLIPGEYIVKFEVLNSYKFTNPNIGSDVRDSDPDLDGITAVFSLASGQNDATVDAGYIPQGEIGNFIWFDTNDNGKQDLGEKGVPGVPLQLMKVGTDGVPIVTLAFTITDSLGEYIFSNLQSGLYRVAINQSLLSSQYKLSTRKNVGLNDLIDSDFDTIFGLSDIIEIDLTDDGMISNYSIDGGLVESCGKVCIPIIIVKNN